MSNDFQFSGFENEVQKIKMRYDKRKSISDQRYSMFAAQTYLMLHELEKIISGYFEIQFDSSFR